LLGIIIVDFGAIYQLLHLLDTGEKQECCDTEYGLFLDFRKPVVKLRGKHYTTFSLNPVCE
jgi:hypothetical protein